MNTLRDALYRRGLCQIDVVRSANIALGTEVLTAPKMSMICRHKQRPTSAQKAGIRLALLDLGWSSEEVDEITELKPVRGL